MDCVSIYPRIILDGNNIFDNHRDISNIYAKHNKKNTYKYDYFTIRKKPTSSITSIKK